MLMPKRTKYRRPHRVKYEGKAKGRKTVAFGDFGLVALDGAWITSRQIEAARIGNQPSYEPVVVRFGLESSLT